MNHVLLVEDDALNRTVIEDIIEFDQIAAELTCVETGEEALDCAPELRPALILMDVGLPGIDGLETTRRLKQTPELKDTPVWVISAHAMKGDAEQALAAGCSTHISKPIDCKQLADRLRDFINQLSAVGAEQCTDY
jgi:two-component system cell cycle response regulator DivK